MPPTTVTLSTLTAEDMICKSSQFQDMITRLSDTQLQVITNAVSLRYDSMMHQIQEAYERQIQNIKKDIIHMQKQQDDNIRDVKHSQKKLRAEMQEQLNTKMNMQNSLLHSMMTMIQDIKDTQINMATDNRQKATETRHTSPSNTIAPTVIHHLQDPDMSYSDTDSEHESDDSTQQPQHNPT
jgi:phage host-nuclease inhibitor protein Gam